MDLTVLRDVCNRYRGCGTEYHLEPIPDNKASNARKSLGLGPAQQIIALVDFTVFGGAEDVMVVTPDGLHWKNKLDPAQLSLSWVQLQQLTFKETPSFLSKSIEFSNGLKLSLSGAPKFITKDNHTVVELLNDLKAIFENNSSESSISSLSESQGSAVPEVIDDGLIDCEFCQKKNKPEVTFCKSCGIKLRG